MNAQETNGAHASHAASSVAILSAVYLSASEDATMSSIYALTVSSRWVNLASEGSNDHVYSFSLL